MENNIPDTRLAYYAGFFDGEGWISILARHQRSSGGKSYKVHTLMIGAAQCDPRPVQMLKADFGGCICIKKNQHLTHHGKHVIYSWQLLSAKAERFLRAVQPFLVHKKEQCDVALSFREFITKRPRYGRDGPSPTEYWDLESEYAALMKRVRADTRELA